MAETKKAKEARAKKRKASTSAAGKSKSARPAAKSGKRSTRKTKTTAAKSKAKAKAPSSKAAASKPQALLETVEESAKDAGGKVAGAASKAKVPLMAGGAALAGAAGGLALGARQAHRKSGLGGVSSKDVARAAKKAGDVGAQIGEVALEVRRARQSTNGNGKVHRSPIEVVLQGLTSRRPHG